MSFHLETLESRPRLASPFFLFCALLASERKRHINQKQFEKPFVLLLPFLSILRVGTRQGRLDCLLFRTSNVLFCATRGH